MKKVRALIKTVKKINSYHYSTLAGVIAFFFMINGGAVIFLSFIFFAKFNIDLTNSLNLVDNQLLQIFLEPIMNESVRISQSYSLFFVITSLWSASTLFYHVIKTGEILYDEPRTKKGYLRRVIAILLVIVFLILLLATIILFLISSTVIRYVDNPTLYLFFQSILVLIVPVGIVMYFNVFVPPKKIPFNMLFKGISFTVLSWVVVTLGLLFYINNFHSFKQVYGTLSFIIIFMIWIYMLSQGLVIGMIINYENWLKFQEDKRYINA